MADIVFPEQQELERLVQEAGDWQPRGAREMPRGAARCYRPPTP